MVAFRRFAVAVAIPVGLLMSTSVAAASTTASTPPISTLGLGGGR